MCQEATAKSGFLNFVKCYFQNSLSINKLFSKSHFGQGGLWLAESAHARFSRQVYPEARSGSGQEFTLAALPEAA